MNDEDVWDFNELREREEPLHPDLLVYVKTVSNGHQMINAPLVQIWPAPVDLRTHGALANKIYASKQKDIAEYLAARNFNGYVFSHERPYRFEAFRAYLFLVNRPPGDRAYWQMMGDVWSDSENVWQAHDAWRRRWRSDRPGRHHTMTAAERRQLDALPDRFAVWRGVGHVRQRTRSALSWTLDEDKARWFADRACTRGSGTRPRLVHGRVNKADVYALLDGRKEQEIVAAKVTVTKVEALDQTKGNA